MKHFVALLIVSLILTTAATADWPQWRGPLRDGVISNFVEPKAWPGQLTLKWKVPVGLGHSSPLLVANRIYLHTRQEEREVVRCLDFVSGKTLWEHGYTVAYTMNPAATGHGKGPKSTPIVHEGKVYTFGITGIVSCLDAKTGSLQWRKDFSGQFRETSPLFGVAMSPAVDNGLLLVHVGGHDDGALVALDARTGNVGWTWKQDGPGYASPIVVEIDGTRQVVTQTQKLLVGISAATGQLLWSIPFTTPYSQNIVTPMVHDGALIFSGLSQPTVALRLKRSGNTWSATEVWKNPDVSMYMNSPVLVGGLLFGLSHRNKGQFFCLDAKTGQTFWTTTGREGENAAALSARTTLFFLTNDADLIVARPSYKNFNIVRRYKVADSPTWAHPVIERGRILVKDLSNLSLWSF